MDDYVLKKICGGETMSFKELLKQRRVWAAILSAISVVSVIIGYPQIAGMCTAVAGGLGLDSYIRPKK